MCTQLGGGCACDPTVEIETTPVGLLKTFFIADRGPRLRQMSVRGDYNSLRQCSVIEKFACNSCVWCCDEFGGLSAGGQLLGLMMGQEYPCLN